MVLDYRRTVVVAAGNFDSDDNPNNHVLNPAIAYNVIAVGNFDDNDTTSWGDDSMASSSSFVNPISNHSDREKPEVAAPGGTTKLVSPS